MNNKMGLTDKEVINSRNKYGKNVLTNKKKNTLFSIIVDSLNDPIIKILLIALVVKIVFLFNDSDIFEIIGILLAILLSSLISSLSEYGSSKAFDKLVEESYKHKVKAYRNGKLEEILVEEVVVDDIVLLSTGDKVPADAKIISGEVFVDESSLTGESKEKEKRINEIVYMGSVVTGKSAKAKIITVGDKTYYGKIAESVQEETPESPLKIRLRHLAKIISKIGYISALIVVTSYLFNVICVQNNFDFNKMWYTLTNFSEIFPHLLYSLTLAVTIIIVSVPEGLPMMITLVLSSNMKRMLKNNVLVKKLVGIETAGSLNILFTDKTGTLTKGTLDTIGFVTAENELFKKVNSLKKYTEFYELLHLSIVYNNSAYVSEDKIIGGNSTERAILNFVEQYDTSKYQVLEKEEFDSKKKYSTVTINYKGKTKFIKGAYEKILDNCKFYYQKDGTKKLIKDKKKIKENIESYAKKGSRILALATQNNSSYTLIGFMMLKDEIRNKAKDGLRIIKNAGVQVTMITGDAKDTAVVIASELNMLDKDSVVLTSEEFNDMTEDEVRGILPNLRVLCRSLPEDKNKLVRIAQSTGLTVGMTGDGVNDAPALKKADVGFAMGSGTEVAREAGDIVILDDNIMSISKSILFGRTIFKSIRKFVVFQLTVNLCAVTLSIIGPFIGVITPVTVVQMLWINMVMDTLAGIAFAYEPPLIEYMEEKPKKKNEPIMNKYMANEILFTGLYCTFMCIFFLKSNFIHSLFRIGNNDKYVMSAFFGLFIFLAIFNAFNARTHRLNIFSNILKNKAFIVVISFVAIVQLILIYFGGYIFRTTGLTLLEFQIMMFLSLTVIPIDFIRKLILKKRNLLTGV